MVLVATFYRFVALPDCRQWQQRLASQCQALGLKGTILLAEEGINATVAGDPEAIATLLNTLGQDPRFADLRVKQSTTTTPPFERMKVKIKHEIVTLGLPEVDPRQGVGIYVPPEEWNPLIQSPDVVVIDARNQPEVAIGSFQGAIDPGIRCFRQLPQYLETTLDPTQQPRVALFCTGGIRCEKATAYLRQQGFDQVYQLQGGILSYLETVPVQDSLWQGECFVFDGRVAVDHALQPGHHDLCRACGYPLSGEDKSDPRYEPGMSCPHCHHSLTPEKRERQRHRQRQYQPEFNSSVGRLD